MSRKLSYDEQQAIRNALAVSRSVKNDDMQIWLTDKDEATLEAALAASGSGVTLTRHEIRLDDGMPISWTTPTREQIARVLLRALDSADPQYSHILMAEGITDELRALFCAPSEENP